MYEVHQSSTMFAIVPDSLDFSVDDAEYFNDYELATDAAFDWSVSLNGAVVKIYEEQEDGYVAVRSVFA